MTDPFDEKLAETIKAGRTNNAEFIAHARSDVPVLVAAVEAVLELHKCIPRNRFYTWPHCNSCPEFTYPCPTVTAIQSALGEQT